MAVISYSHEFGMTCRSRIHMIPYDLAVISYSHEFRMTYMNSTCHFLESRTQIAASVSLQRTIVRLLSVSSPYTYVGMPLNSLENLSFHRGEEEWSRTGTVPVLQVKERCRQPISPSPPITLPGAISMVVLLEGVQRILLARVSPH